MGQYRIKVNYETGDSFQHYKTDGFLDLTWDNLDIAKENLQAIKEHYQMYRDIERGYNHHMEREKIASSYSNKNWFVGEKDRLFVGEDENTDKKDYCIIENTPKNRKKYKYHELRYDLNVVPHCMKIKADNGNFMQQSNFWCGYFEHLESAEIVSNTEEFKIYV